MRGIPEQLNFGRYKIVRLLGRGGMGEVYLADDLSLRRQVAIKVIASEELSGDEARRSVIREARAAASLDHPYICTVFETGETPDGQAYIVMQYVEGETLAALLQRGPMQVRDALALSAQIAEALGSAHRHGVIHRDLKPGNVMVTPSGQPKLLDFGIAKHFLGSAPADATTMPAATAPGAVVGTPAYMSPEQLRQRPLDGRSDLFSLGALLYECLTGHPAFQGSTSIETMGNVLHVYPPAASQLNSSLDGRHDELCRRLLAKEPADRFQSTDEVIGAIRLLLPDTSQIIPLDTARKSGRMRHAVLAAVCLVLAAGAAGAWWRARQSGLPPVPPGADLWYQRGTEAVREGSYQTARRRLDQAVQLFPQHVLAYARRAEANAELDDGRAAQDDLLRVSALVSDESRLPQFERLRLEAVRALVLRDVDVAVDRYKQVVTLNPADAGAWVDLGRAQDAAGLRTDARTSYQRAIERNQQYAAAFLRLGHIEGLDLRYEEALKAFAEAERLYRAASDVEGETEVLLLRGDMRDSQGDLGRARADLERALVLATNTGTISQAVRTRLALSSVTASQGRFTESEAVASQAVRDAVDNGLDTVAAEGLVDVSASLLESGRTDEAGVQAKRAIDLAEHRGAARTTARARLQLAEVYRESDHALESLAIVDAVRPFLKANRYRRYEMFALLIASRAHQQLDQLDRARQMSSDVLSIAESVKDDAQVALAAGNLASVSTALGEYPAALVLRERAEEIHRRQGYAAVLPFDLANRADLLIRLGKIQEADKPLAELEAGISAGIESYVGRRRRAGYLRGLAAATADRYSDALRLFEGIKSRTSRDSTDILAPAVAAYCAAMTGSRIDPVVAADVADTALARERSYWLAAAALGRKNAGAALGEVDRGLALLGDLPNDELRWRLTGLGALAAEASGDAKRLADSGARSKVALGRIRSSWGAAFESYAQRRDLAVLIRKLESIWNRPTKQGAH